MNTENSKDKGGRMKDEWGMQKRQTGAGLASHSAGWYHPGGLEALMKLTAVFQKVRGGYVGFVEELPGANTQGRTLAEARRNLAEAVQLVLDANRQLAEGVIVQGVSPGHKGAQKRLALEGR
jgi:predicted RNase H-like HicB family nuclease